MCTGTSSNRITRVVLVSHFLAFQHRPTLAEIYYTRKTMHSAARRRHLALRCVAAPDPV